MAFLINAYNAFMVEKILTRYPDIHSIWDFGKVFGNPFKDRFFTLLGGHDEPRRDRARASLRKRYARSAHPLRGELRLDRLPDAARGGLRRGDGSSRSSRSRRVRFLSDRSRNRARDGRLEVSKIFDWFKEDFEPRARYFARHAALLLAMIRRSRADQRRQGCARLPGLRLVAQRLTVVVPALNEAGGIRAALEALAPLRARGHEVIVADGGSSDGTARARARLCDRRGRARRAGARRR